MWRTRCHAEPIKSGRYEQGRYEQKEIRCAQGGGGEVAAWGRTGHAARSAAMEASETGEERKASMSTPDKDIVRYRAAVTGARHAGSSVEMED